MKKEYVCLFEIMLLISSTIAFSFILSAELISATVPAPGTPGYEENYENQKVAKILVPTSQGLKVSSAPIRYTSKLTEPKIVEGLQINGKPLGKVNVGSLTKEVTNGVEKVGIVQDGKFIEIPKNELSKFGDTSSMDWVQQGATPEKAGLLPSTWLPAGTTGDALLTGLQWVGIAYGAGQLIGYVFGLEKETTTALSASLAAG